MNATDTTHSRTVATAPQLAEFVARTGTAQAGAVVHRTRPAPVVANPTITPASTIIVVRKPQLYTNPARVPITLRVSAPFRGSGILEPVTTPTSGGIHIFKTRTAAREMQVNGTDNRFNGRDLARGVQVFATADRASGALNDFQLRLTLTPGPTAGPPVTVSLTAVSLTLDIFMTRTVAGTAPLELPQPAGAAAPAVRTDKWFGGRFVHVQDPPGNHHGRAMLQVTVQPAGPTGFNGTLVLRRVSVTAADAVGAVDNKAQLFDNENPTPGEVVHPATLQFNANTLSPTGTRSFFAQGATVSGVLRDTGFQLGVVLSPTSIENDGDRVRLTVIQFSNLIADVPSTAPNSVRVSPPASTVNSPVARHTLDTTNFAEDFALPTTLVLVENSIAPADRVNLSVRVAPAGVPVLWEAQRDTAPGTGDAQAIIDLNPGRAAPTLLQNAANNLQATLLADNVGSFFIRPFVDSNGNNTFDIRIDKEPFIVMNLVLIRAEGVTNASVANVPATAKPIVTGTFNAPVATIPTTAGFDVTTGNATGGVSPFANPTVSGVHNFATIKVTGGGPNGRRGLDRLMAGWINNEVPVPTSLSATQLLGPPGRDAAGVYIDPANPGTPHRRFSIWTPPTITPVPALAWAAGLASSGGARLFPPANAEPPLAAGPFLDCSPFGSEGTGGDTPVGTESAAAPGPPVDPATPPGAPPQIGISKAPVAPGVGERWQIHMWDSPGEICNPVHGGFPGTLQSFRYNQNFRTDLCVWTNLTAVSGATPDAAARLYSSVQTNTWTVRFDATLVNPPAAPTITPAAGGTLPAGTYRVRVTYVFPGGGETTASGASTACLGAGCVPPNANNALTITSPAASGTATGYRVYVSPANGAAGTETRQGGTILLGTNTTINNVGAGAAPPVAGFMLPGTNTVRLTPDTLPTRLAIPVQGSGLEVRGPITLRMFSVHART